MKRILFKRYLSVVILVLVGVVRAIAMPSESLLSISSINSDLEQKLVEDIKTNTSLKGVVLTDEQNLFYCNPYKTYLKAEYNVFNLYSLFNDIYRKSDYYYTWSSDNTDVVTRDNDGRVNIVGEGKATITCKLYNQHDYLLKTETLEVIVLYFKIIADPDPLSGTLGPELDFDTLPNITLKVLDTEGKVHPIYRLKLETDNSNVFCFYQNNTVYEKTYDGVTSVDFNDFVFRRPGTANLKVTVTSYNGVVLERNVSLTVETPSVSIVKDGKKIKELTEKVSNYGRVDAVYENYRGGSLYWSTSDPEIIEIMSSSWTGPYYCSFKVLKEGTAVLRAVNYHCSDSIIVHGVLDLSESKISLYKDDIALLVGKETKLSYKITPNNWASQPLKWTSSNKAVATVDENGTVKAIAAGEATITVAMEKDSSIKATCRVIVYKEVKLFPAELISVDGFTLRWEAVPNVVAYNVVIDDPDESVRLATYVSHTNSMEVTPRAASHREYSCYISAQLRNDEFTENSNRVKVVVPWDYPVPTANENVKRNGNKVTLSWSVPDNTGRGWYVYVKPKIKGVYQSAQRFTGESSKTITLEVTENVQGFKFYVTSYSYLGKESLPSNEVTVNLMNTGDVEGIDADAVGVSVEGNTLTLSGLNPDESVSIYSIVGQMIYKGNDRVITLNPGTYLVHIRGEMRKVMIR